MWLSWFFGYWRFDPKLFHNSVLELPVVNQGPVVCAVNRHRQPGSGSSKKSPGARSVAFYFLRQSATLRVRLQIAVLGKGFPNNMKAVMWPDPR